MRRKKQPEPEAIRFLNGLAEPPIYWLIVGEQDVKDLNAGIVPNWLILVTDFELRPNPKPSDRPPVIPEEVAV